MKTIPHWFTLLCIFMMLLCASRGLITWKLDEKIAMAVFCALFFSCVVLGLLQW